MANEERLKIIKPYLTKSREANDVVRQLKSDVNFVAHLQRIKEAEAEANKLSSELYDILWALPLPEK